MQCRPDRARTLDAKGGGLAGDSVREPHAEELARARRRLVAPDRQREGAGGQRPPVQRHLQLVQAWAARSLSAGCK